MCLGYMDGMASSLAEGMPAMHWSLLVHGTTVHPKHHLVNQWALHFAFGATAMGVRVVHLQAASSKPLTSLLRWAPGAPIGRATIASGANAASALLLGRHAGTTSAFGASATQLEAGALPPLHRHCAACHVAVALPPEQELSSSCGDPLLQQL